MSTDKPSPSKVNIDPRVVFAAERTLLAWLRTGLSMMGFGFVVARLGIFSSEWGHAPAGHSLHLSFWIGTSLVFLSAGVFLIAVLQHFRFIRHVTHGDEYVPSRGSLGAVLALILAALCVGLAIYLAKNGPV